MPKPDLHLTFRLRYTPQPGILRAISAYQRSLKSGLTPVSKELELPMVFKTAGSDYLMSIGADAYEIAAKPLDRIDRYGPAVTSLCSQFLKNVRGIAPREISLKAELNIPVPDASALGGYSVAGFSWPRKLELRPEALGQDHFLPTETGLIHLRLSVHSSGNRNILRLLVANRHERVSAAADVVEQAYSLCMRGIAQVVQGVTSPAYQRMLLYLLSPQGGG